MERSICIEASTPTPMARRRVEVVERKGVGHPDTICDSVAEAVSRALCGLYLERAGRVLHHNADKALLVAGRSAPRMGGGSVLEPMRLVLGDRATSEWEGVTLPVEEVAVAAVERWVREHLRFVDPAVHLRVECAMRPGAEQLADLFERGPAPAICANDTSVGVGYAPLSETERLVLAAERRIASASFQERFPAAGEDIKVMGVREGRALELTVAVAMVDRFVADAGAYFDLKVAMRDDLVAALGAELDTLTSLEVVLNALDREERGTAGMYLTVLGTSAEGADSGEVGRGNRVNGLIAFGRPQSLEAAAGKNPVSHVGKLYNLLAHRIAARLLDVDDALEEVNVLLCSRIGEPLDRPRIAGVDVVLAEGAGLRDVEARLRSSMERELDAVPEFVARVLRDGATVC